MECGKCCHNREDIILTPLDLYKMAKHLEMPITQFIFTYCACYKHKDTKLPFIVIEPRGLNKICPLNENGKCSVHAVKPYLCALAPLGFMYYYDNDEYAYFLQPSCEYSGNQEQTVKQWLDKFSLLDDEEFTIIWHKYTHHISDILNNIQEQKGKELFYMILVKLYINYDLEKDFFPQFINNCDEILSLLKNQ